MPSLVQGRLVYAKIPIPDPQGHNPKQGRPFVVISRNEDINQGGVIHAVGITTELQSAPAECYVLLSYGPNAKTGLKQKSAPSAPGSSRSPLRGWRLTEATSIPIWSIKS